MPRHLTERTKQNGKRQDDDNKDVRVLRVKDKKVATIIADAKPVVRKLLIVLIKGLTECTKQSGSKYVDNDKEIKVLACKSRKVAMTTTSAKPASMKLLIASAKEVLEKDM